MTDILAHTSDRQRGGVATFDAATVAQIDDVVEHVNATHADTVLFVARHLDPDATDAELGPVDPLGATFAVRRGDGTAGVVRLDFPSPASGADDARTQLFGAIAAARAAADPSAPLTSLEAEMAASARLATTHGHVVDVRPLTPNLVEVTLGGFAGYPLTGGDEFVYVMVSHADGGIDPAYSMDDYMAQGDDAQGGAAVRGAYYTVRRSRPDDGEIDLWVVLHDAPGSVADWMATARAGDRLALWGPRRGFEPPADAQHVALVADETGFAAVAAIVESLPGSSAITAVVETVDEQHHVELPAHPGLRVVWVHRRDDPPGSVNRLLDAVAAAFASPAEAPDAAFGAAESRRISAVRRHLRQQLDMPATAVLMTGYWRART